MNIQGFIKDEEEDRPIEPARPTPRERYIAGMILVLNQGGYAVLELNVAETGNTFRTVLQKEGNCLTFCHKRALPFKTDSSNKLDWARF